MPLPDGVISGMKPMSITELKLFSVVSFFLLFFFFFFFSLFFPYLFPSFSLPGTLIRPLPLKFKVFLRK